MCQELRGAGGAQAARRQPSGVRVISQGALSPVAWVGCVCQELRGAGGAQAARRQPAGGRQHADGREAAVWCACYQPGGAVACSGGGVCVCQELRGAGGAQAARRQPAGGRQHADGREAAVWCACYQPGGAVVWCACYQPGGAVACSGGGVCVCQELRGAGGAQAARRQPAGGRQHADGREAAVGGPRGRVATRAALRNRTEREERDAPLADTQHPARRRTRYVPPRPLAPLPPSPWSHRPLAIAAATGHHRGASYGG